MAQLAKVHIKDKKEPLVAYDNYHYFDQEHWNNPRNEFVKVGAHIIRRDRIEYVEVEDIKPKPEAQEQENDNRNQQ